MILIVILSQPATNEMGMYIRSLISHQQIDLAYIVKKLSRINPKKADLKDIASFLAEHMHFEYVGFHIDHQLYSSSNNFKISPELIKEISEMGEPEDGIWQDFKGNPEIWKESNICAVAALRDGHGKTYGQLIIGNPKNKNKFARRDLVEIETIIDLTSVIIESKRNIQATKKG